MRRFFVAPEAVQDDMVQFDAELARHMGKVLRLNVGEQVTVSTGDGMAYLVELTAFMKDAVTGRIVERIENLQETAIEVVLYQPDPRAYPGRRAGSEGKERLLHRGHHRGRHRQRQAPGHRILP